MNSFTGTQKSSIQVIGELLQIKAMMFESLEDLVTKYEVNGNIFCAGTNGAHEMTEGYAGVVADYKTLDEAYKSFNVCSQAIWIHDHKYTVCNLYKSLNDVEEEQIIDIANKQLL